MTDTEYLQNLDLLEGSGDKKGVTATSSKYGITNAGIERVTRNIRLQDENGNYTDHALRIQGSLDKKLLKTLMDNMEWKNGTLTKQASVEQISKLGEKAWENLALTTRDLNKLKIERMGGAPLDEDVIDRICLAAHNRESLLNDKKVKKAIASGNDEVIRHEMLNNFDFVTQDVLPGIRRRLASLFNVDWGTKSVSDAWKSFDKGGREAISQLVNIEYDKDKESERARIRELSIMQAGDSQVGEKYKPSKNPRTLPNEEEFLSALFPNPLPMSKVTKQPQQPIAAPKPPQERTFVEKVADSVKAAFGAFTGDSNQVANEPENILNSANGEQQ